MIFGSLFAGIGGIDLGLERAGMTCKWQVEIDDFCNKVLEKHWTEVKRYRDVREVGKHNLEPVDLITGGFPCQPHSVAGKRRGKDDDRDLWPEYLRIIREIKPRWVVGENVPGIITTMLDDVLSDLEGAGYTPTVFNIPVAAFGANHIRYRIFIIAHSNRVGWTEGAGAEIRHEEQKPEGQEPEYICEGISGTENLANTDQSGLCQRENEIDTTVRGQPSFARSTISGEKIANPASTRLERQVTERWNGREQGLLAECGWGAVEPGMGGMVDGLSTRLDGNWRVEPDIPRVATGIKNRLDRLKSLGNAVVPQVAEYIGRCILEAEQELEDGK